jgi:hypothetical protein
VDVVLFGNALRLAYRLVSKMAWVDAMRKEKRKDCPHCGLPLRLRKLPPVRRRRDKFWSHVYPGSAAICRDMRRMARHREQK